MHITFSLSAGGGLKHGLKQVKSNDTVLSLSDSLNVGPINEPWGEDRKQFMKKSWLSYPSQEHDIGINDWSGEITEFWEKALIQESKTIWWSSNSAMDWCGLMMLIEHLETNTEIKIIDVSKLVSNRHIISVGELAPEELIELKDESEILSDTFREELQKRWEELKTQQDKPIRWLTTQGLISVEWEVLDKSLLEILETLEAVPAARLIGECLSTFSEEFNQVTDTILWYRLQHLLNQRKIKTSSREAPLNFNTQIQLI